MNDKQVGSIVGTGRQIGDDGAYMLEVSLGDETFEVRIDPEHIPELLSRLQSIAIADATGKAQNVTMAQVVATDIALAHRGREVALMVSTDQIGALAIQIPDELLERLKSELDRMTTYRSAPPLDQ